MVNTSEREYREAIFELERYQFKLTEISNNILVAVKKARNSMPEDQNIEYVGKSLDIQIQGIHESIMMAKKLAVELSEELQAIERSGKELEG